MTTITTMKKIKSIHSSTASEIRKEFKLKFPTTQFFVRSRSFSNGDAVDISWVNGPTDDAVCKIVNKYQFGNFDSMRDIYENTNVISDIPQVKYVHCRREISKDVKETIFTYLKQTHHSFDHLNSIDESCSILLKNWGVWTAENYIWRITNDLDLSKGIEEWKSEKEIKYGRQLFLKE